jgi:hypothetical protein
MSDKNCERPDREVAFVLGLLLGAVLLLSWRVINLRSELEIERNVTSNSHTAVLFSYPDDWSKEEYRWHIPSEVVK